VSKIKSVKLQKRQLLTHLLVGGILSFAIAAGTGCRREPPAPPPPAAAAAVTAPTTTASTPAPPVRRSYLDVVRANYTEFPATQPLSNLLDLEQAAHLQFSEPLYLSPAPQAELWITRPDAPPIQTVLHDAADPNADVDAHVIDRIVNFVDWMPGDSGDWKPYVVCRRDDGGYDIFWSGGQRILKRKYDYHWESAFAWNRLTVEPTTGGISIVDLTGATEEAHYEFAPAPNALPVVPQALTDLQGIVAWTSWDARVPGSGEAARFVDGKWSALTAHNGWPGKLVHVVPLLDGSALQLLGSQNKGVRLAVTTLEKVNVDEARISALVDQLNDTEETKRVDAYEQLTRYGPGIWPILEKLAPDQPPEAADRLAELLRDKTEPTLGGMKLLGGKSLTVADRLADGGVIFYAPDGVSIPNPGGEAETQQPAWISVRPGEPIALLPEALTVDLTPETSRIWAIGDEWIVRSNVQGPRQFVGSGFVDLLRKDETAFDDLVGIDHRGRWVFREHTDNLPAKNGAAGKFLIIDPALPDPTPRLPGWTFTTADSVGWDKDGWPVVKRGAAFALMETDWRLMDPKEKILSGAEDAATEASNPSRTTTPATIPATRATSAKEELGPVILTAPDGTRYYDGRTSLRAIDNAGQETTWSLPAAGNGKATPHLIRTADGRLYLLNQGGRILRVRPTPAKKAPFEIEATFTHDVPDTDNPSRVWLDPGGRIDIEWGNHLTVFFPKGYIPRQIAEKMESGGAGAP
jgi:hypothetical protein